MKQLTKDSSPKYKSSSSSEKQTTQSKNGQSQGTQTGALYQPRGVGWGGRWEGGSTGRGHMYTYGCCSLTENNKILQSKYPSTKK